MATLSISDQLMSRVEAQAAAEGFESVEAYISWLVEGTDYSGPPELTIHSDEQLEALVKERIDGPWVEVDAADFARMREKFVVMLREGAAGPKREMTQADFDQMRAEIIARASASRQ